MAAVIRVIGEALVDVVSGADGGEHVELGGAPFNTARAIARLGGDVEFVGAISTDERGERLDAALRADGVDVGHVVRTPLPTTAAHAAVAADGGARYEFRLAGTSAPALTASDLEALPGSPHAVFTGGLALVADPLASAIGPALRAVEASVPVMIDLNARPAAIGEGMDRYLEVVRDVVGRAAVLKVSDEDLDVVGRDGDAVASAGALLETGPSVVLVTAGADGSTIVTASDVRHVPAAPPPGPVVDTIGAGDAFDGAFLHWLVTHDVMPDRLRAPDAAELIRPGVEFASRAAAFAVTRRGADPPHLADLHG